MITVCYNAKKSIEETIKSVINQSDFVSIEYIVVDGASDDGTEVILNKYRAFFDFFVSEPDSGIYDALNKGLKLATGNYVLFLHSGDVFYNRQSVSKFYSLIKKHNNPDVFLGSIYYRQARILANYKKDLILDGSLFSPLLLRIGIMPPHPSIIAASHVYKEIGNFDTSYQIASDFHFCVKLFLLNNFSFKSEHVVLIEMSGGGMSNLGIKSILKISFELISIMKKHKMFIFSYLTLLRLPVKFIVRLICRRSL